MVPLFRKHPFGIYPNQPCIILSNGYDHPHTLPFQQSEGMGMLQESFFFKVQVRYLRCCQVDMIYNIE